MGTVAKQTLALLSAWAGSRPNKSTWNQSHNESSEGLHSSNDDVLAESRDVQERIRNMNAGFVKFREGNRLGFGPFYM